MDKEKVFAQHEENVEFLNKLAFYKEDLTILQNRLDEVASKNSSADCLMYVERFQNQIKIQHNNIDVLRHDVKQDENRIEAAVLENPVAVDHRSIPYHEKEKEGVDNFERNFNDLRGEMNEFFAKWM